MRSARVIQKRNARVDQVGSLLDLERRWVDDPARDEGTRLAVATSDPAIGAELVAKAPPDGYTLYLASQTTHAVAPALLPRVGYDPLKDFATVVRVAHNPLLMVVHPSMPVKSFKDFAPYRPALEDSWGSRPCPYLLAEG